MKWILATVLLLTVGVGTGMASLVTVDFSTLGTTTQDITSVGYTLGNVTFTYVPISDSMAGVSSNGVTGSAFGDGSYLEMDFSSPVVFLGFNFTLTEGDSLLPNADPQLNAGGGFSQFLTDPLNNVGLATTAAFSHSPFTSAFVFFDGDADTTFRVYNVQYDTGVSGVPEPGTYALLASGLFLLGFGRRKLLKRRS